MPTKRTSSAKARLGRTGAPTRHARIYRQALRALNDSGVPYMVSGAFAMYHYAGVSRDTKDLDLFLERRHVGEALAVLEAAGFTVELTDALWLAKAKQGDVYIDLIFAAGNLVAEIDEEWYRRARPASVLGYPVKLASPEDLISFKAFICERHRFDGADIAHMIRGLEGRLDWAHLIRRMGEHWELLLFHLTFFDYVYPCHRDYVPGWVKDELIARTRVKHVKPSKRGLQFRGTLVSLHSFVRDVEEGYRDLRTEYRAKGNRARAA